MRTLASLVARLVLATSATLAACGNDHALSGGDDVGQPDAGAVDGSGSSADGFVPLVSTDWSLDPSSEKYLCVRVTMTQDVYIKSIEPIAPAGTHHSVLMLAPTPDAPDGVTECSSILTDPAIYASGVGTQPFVFPDNVGLHIKAGEQLFLNLHLFNAGEATLTGTSGVSYVPAAAGDFANEAGTVLAGKTIGLKVVPGASDQVGTCTTPGGLTVFAVAPHMHLLGAHMKAVYTPSPGAEPITVLDTDYSFDDQEFHQVPQFTTTEGGKYVVTCSYVNSTGSVVHFGESTTDEMCFAMTYMYPPQANPVCSN